jgi:hypothetical protein
MSQEGRAGAKEQDAGFSKVYPEPFSRMAH